MSSERCCDNYKPLTDIEGEQFCGGCGIVTGREFPEEFGKKLFNEKKMLDLSHAAPLSTDISAGNTVISDKNVDYSGGSISSKISQEMYRLKIWDKRAINRSKTYSGKAFQELQNYMSKLNMNKSQIIEAKKFLSKCIKMKITRGRTYLQIESGIIHAISKKYDLGKTLEEISKEVGVKPKAIIRSYKIFNRNFESDINNEKNGEKIYSYRSNKMVNINRILQNLGLSRYLENKIKTYMTKILNLSEMEFYMGGKGMSTIHGATIYCMKIHDEELDLCLNQNKIAKSVGITEVTIRNRYKEIDKLIEKSGKSDEIWKFE